MVEFRQELWKIKHVEGCDVPTVASSGRSPFYSP